MPRAHLELHAAFKQTLEQASRSSRARRQNTTLERQLASVKAQRPCSLNSHAGSLEVPITPHETALHLAAILRLSVQEETTPSVRHVLQLWPLALLELAALALQHGLLVLQGHAVVTNRLSGLVAVLCPTSCSSNLLRRQHCVLHEVQGKAVGLISKICKQHVGTSNNARVEKRANGRSSPYTHLPVLCDLGHVEVMVLRTCLRGDKTGARLHFYNLEAVAVNLRDETTKSKGIALRKL
mmetsp:Transcript_107098/g.268427  ORF Transcript_107098/g.268427 Transcript_107098/m.268427 type:complete len:239 (+) Transcript_107098:313-1029(+)